MITHRIGGIVRQAVHLYPRARTPVVRGQYSIIIIIIITSRTHARTHGTRVQTGGAPRVCAYTGPANASIQGVPKAPPYQTGILQREKIPIRRRDISECRAKTVPGCPMRLRDIHETDGIDLCGRYARRGGGSQNDSFSTKKTPKKTPWKIPSGR